VSADFLGLGWKFPIAVDGLGAIVRSDADSGIEESIWLILGTAKGERAMRPDFGCGIHDLVFSMSNTATAGRVAEEVRDALVRWEPRIDVLNVEATTTDDQPERLMIAISYRVRMTNNVFNLVYPFYLDQAAA
jgi:phage baseplate assembly protein W